MSLVYLTIMALALFLSPEIAYAWGPGLHLDIALTVLQHSFWALPAVRLLIETYPNEYIYGSVSPDIMVGKKYAGAMHHCHNWSIGKLILEESSTDMERTAAWGYLTHLVADCVAHNYFVPFKMIRTFRRPALSHVYWEMRYDLHVPEKCWKELDHVIRRDYRPFDHLLERVLKKTLFSFRTNKRIFNNILILHRMKQLRSGLKTFADASQWKMAEADIKQYRETVIDAVKDFLRHPESATCLNADPSGARKLQYATDLRRQLRKMVAKKQIDSKKVDPFIVRVKQKLYRGLYDASMKLPDIQELL